MEYKDVHFPDRVKSFVVNTIVLFVKLWFTYTTADRLFMF